MIVSGTSNARMEGTFSTPVILAYVQWMLITPETRRLRVSKVQISHYMWSLTLKNNASLVVIKIDVRASLIIEAIKVPFWTAQVEIVIIVSKVHIS